MQFGVLQFFSWPQRRVPLPTVYERAFDRVHVMEETGYDAVWLAEHHFSTYSVCRRFTSWAPISRPARSVCGSAPPCR